MRPSDKGILSPTLISLEDTDGLVNIAQSLQFNPELYATVRELITEIKNSLVISIKAKAKVKRSPIWYQLTKEKPIEKNYSRLLKDFHRIWARNLTLQSEWKNWYRENANYSEKDWQEIITLKASVKSFERIFHDCDFNGYNCPEVSNPLILDPKRGSSPTILNPFIFSPYILRYSVLLLV